MLEIELIVKREFGSGQKEYIVKINGILDDGSDYTDYTERFAKLNSADTIREIIKYSGNEILNFLDSFMFETDLEEWGFGISITVENKVDPDGYGIRKIYPHPICYCDLYNNIEKWKSPYNLVEFVEYLKKLPIDTSLFPNIGFYIAGRNLHSGFGFAFINRDLNAVVAEELSELMEATRFMLTKAKEGLDAIYMGKSHSYIIPKELQTAFKQYFTYFQEYVEIAKGKKIKFDILSTEDGVRIETSGSEDINELNVYFNEYLSFVKSNIDDLQPKVEVKISEEKKELLIIGLKQQISHFKNQLELKNLEVKFLEKEVQKFENLLLANYSTRTHIYLNSQAYSASQSESKAEAHATANIDFKMELQALQKELSNLKQQLPAETHASIKQEIEAIDDALLEVDENSKSEAVDKKPFRKIRRLFDQLADEDSDFGKIVKGSVKLKETMQKLGKSYNKVAQWVALPVIPDVLLEL